MASSRTTIKSSKSDKDKDSRLETSTNGGKPHRLSAPNLYDECGRRVPSSAKNFSEWPRPYTVERGSNWRAKGDKPFISQARDPKKSIVTAKLKEDLQGHRKRYDRDFRRFKAKYNSSVGNILREWVNLIYCILILRMNLIQFIIDKFPDFSQGDVHLQKQIMLESRMIFKIIKKAQHYSQEQFLGMWTHLEKLINNRMVLKSAFDAIQMKETALRDWKAASEKLAQLQEELLKVQSSHRAIQKNKTQFELMAKEKMAKLESLAAIRNAELDHLVQQITELKNNEVQMRGKILLNIKSYRDLKNKRQSIMNMEKEMNHLKSDQTALMKEYTMKINSLKTEVEQKEKEIKIEKEEKKKLKATLVGFGDFSEKQTLVTLHQV